MLNQLNENELKELHVIHQVIGKLSLAHRPVAWRFGIPKNIKDSDIALNTLDYLSLIHSESENIKDILSDTPMNDLNSYKEQLKEAITRADNKYNQDDLHPHTVQCLDTIRELLEI
ncbi:hypothetical protein QI045_12710 [Staphylococcus saprophyticus]|nr:hypothetical protein [Staphylococcus saprophyticus]